ncbi:nicotinate-nucleotide adenylyltransferase [Vogesella oryzae]|uniref:nicotinate-nucleotide adenylyltransferase n=1 Tax=Vogesella oryzae TaxID=1735285 RepID=UPI001FE77142|nr:nicotinate-nucleotide adenylyltransferase [Vogesella oryzae]
MAADSRQATTAAAPAPDAAAAAMRRVGMFGGTFDPIHSAHLRMAEAFFAQCRLDELRLIPAGNPYHRDRGPQASAAQRLAMVQLAIAGHPGWLADDREVMRPRPAYTVETLEELRAELGPACQLWLLIGGDSLHQLPTWQRWQDILQLANIAVAVRPGFDAANLPAELQPYWRQVPDFSNSAASGTIRALTLPPVPLSATLLRHKLACGEDCSGLMAPEVMQYITRHRLYRSTAR